MSGVYAWYRNFKIDAAAQNNSEIFVSSILEELGKPHCITREIYFPPSHRLIVKPETRFSKHKQEALKQYANNFFFRELLITLLNNCLLFQQPLYIGKASNLRTRIQNHLSVESILRERLKEAKHDIEQCRLLVLICSENICSFASENTEIEEDGDSEVPQLEPEQLIEDILSRLFLPSFTIKYG